MHGEALLDVAGIQQPTIVVAASNRDMLRRLCGMLNERHYRTLEACRYTDVARLLCRCQPSVILTEATLIDGSWKDILGLIAPLNNRPTVVVTDRLGDEQFWAEVLNLGGFDVLPQPLDEHEFERVIEAALRQFHSTTSPPTPSEITRELGCEYSQPAAPTRTQR